MLQNESLKEEIAHLKEELSKIQQKYDTMLTVNIKVAENCLCQFHVHRTESQLTLH